MKVLTQFLDRNKERVKELFNRMSKQGEIPATSVFSYLQQLFSQQSIHIIQEGKEYFADDQNQEHTGKIIEQYFKTTPQGKSGKFYLYRINFTLDQVKEYLEYWLCTDRSLRVVDPAYVAIVQSDKNQQPANIMKDQYKNGSETMVVQELKGSTILENEFIAEGHKKEVMIEAYENQIQKYEKMLDNQTNNAVESDEIHRKIQHLKSKITEAKAQIPVQRQSKQKSKSKTESPAKSTAESTHKSKKQTNFKILFDFYAKTNHLTGIKASFERIEHESQTINYQKLVHFLKEYDLFPSKPHIQKRIHNLYVRSCSNTRDLHYEDFIQFLDKIPEVIIQLPPGETITKKEFMMAKIQSKSEKNKLLHNPFHSLQKQDFRIDPHIIKYEFKLQPLNGKMIHEISSQLQTRKKQKEETKQLATKQKEEQHIKKLKKLMAIDPYHPLVVKNSRLLEQRSISVMEPIASLDNMEKFRDASFDMKAHFGIDDANEDPMKPLSNRYDTNKRAEQIERDQSQRMSLLMNSLIERSEAKLAKLGISAGKREASSKIN